MIIFIIGIIGVSLFVIASVVGGILIEDYSVISQFISESYAIDTEYGVTLRAIGYIPSGIFITIYCFLASKHFRSSKLAKIGFYGLGVFYGIATVIVGLFSCDSGCNKALIDPSISQIINNLTGLLTYIFVPISMLFIGFGLKKIPSCKKLSIQAFAYSISSMLFVYLLSSDSTSEFIGLYQRIIEALFVVWIVASATAIKNNLGASSAVL